MTSETGVETDPQMVVEELDWKSQEILRALLENGGTANTTELRSLTGIDDNNKINYRYRNKLTPRGLVDLEQPETEGNKLLPQIATLTTSGEAVAKQVVESHGEPTSVGDAVEEFNARLTRVEAKVDRLDTDVHSDGPSPRELQAEINDLDEKLEALYRNMARFRDYLNERDDGGYSEFANQRES